MSQLNKLIFLLLISCFLSGCVTFQTYAPNAVHVPLMEKKADLEGYISYGGSNGIDAGACYAVTNFIAVMGNIQWNEQKINTPIRGGDYIQQVNYKMFEFAPGIFMDIDDFLKFEIYAGLGFGNEFRDYRYKTYPTQLPLISEGNFYRTFLQLNLGHVIKNFEIGFATRFTFVTFPELNLSGYADYNDGYPTVLQDFSKFYLEPVLNMNFGHKNIKFNFQSGLSTGPKIEFLTSTNIILRAGIQFRFNLLKEKE